MWAGRVDTGVFSCDGEKRWEEVMSGTPALFEIESSAVSVSHRQRPSQIC